MNKVLIEFASITTFIIIHWQLLVAAIVGSLIGSGMAIVMHLKPKKRP